MCITLLSFVYGQLAEQISIVKRQTPNDEEMVITTDFLIVHKSYKDRATVKPISNPDGFAIGYEMNIAGRCKSKGICHCHIQYHDFTHLVHE